ncbi:MAG TPA: ion channel [Candidatus Binatia bacterium]|jgi:inward rectifier potassium channel
MSDKTARKMPALTSEARLNYRRIGLQRDGFSDIYHRLVAASWPMLLVFLACLYLSVNALFAIAYMTVGGVTNARPGSFADAFFFSIQTIATIGYGTMAPESFAAHMVVVCEVFVGLVGLAMITGITFSKFARPTARVRFSRNAIITTREGVPSLIFRMANERGTSLVEASAHVALLRDEVTLEGEEVRRFHDLALIRQTNLLFTLSWTVVHPIAAPSPLVGADAQSLEAVDAAVVVSVLGIDETTGQTVHARHAYNAADILWNVRFADMFSESGGQSTMDFGRFDHVVANDGGTT